MNSEAAPIGDGPIRAGQISDGLFGSLNVQPPFSEYYRSQVVEEDLHASTTEYLIPDGDGTKVVKPDKGSCFQRIFNKKKMEAKCRHPSAKKLMTRADTR